MSLTKQDIREMADVSVNNGGPWDDRSIKLWMWLTADDAGVDVTEPWVIVCPT